ncbi:MAG: helix-turn-helix domain-containing protein [Ketobacteraceae bacterium]|nr:helix-turn-helix domain-containing protein [Ketobacteraceae bacterium]
MRWEEMQEETCSVARTLSVIGDRWTLLILRDAFLRVRRFEDFQKKLGISRHRLSERLKKLVKQGVMAKVQYQSSPPRYEYRLTEKGIDLYPVIMMMVRWGDKWMDDGNGAPMVYRHKSCGEHFTPVISCSECHEPLKAREVIPEYGPGLLAAGNHKEPGGGL